MSKGIVSFVGAGPGAEDLMTLRGIRKLEICDIVIWASSLVPESLLNYCKSSTLIFDSATMTLEDVLNIYDENRDKKIVRLHSGDPSIYGAIEEQMVWLKDNDVDFEIIPGVTSLSAASAILKTELTIPRVSQSVIVTRLASRTKTSMPASEDLPSLCASGATVAVFLSASRPNALQEALLTPPSKFNEETHCAVIYRATWPDEAVVRCEIKNLAKTIRSMKVSKTVLVIVGDVLNTKEVPRSHLYLPEFQHSFRSKSKKGSSKGIAKPASKLKT